MGLLDKLKSKKSEKKRVAVLGIDGVPYGLLQRGMEEGWLENFAELPSAGPMNASVPVVSSVCWPCATTGLNPGGTGVYGFLERKRGTNETYVPLSVHVNGDRVWDRVGDAGKRSLVMNVPVTFPPDDVKGTLVGGFLSPDVDAASSSPELASRLKKMGYRVDADVSLHGDRDKFMKNIHETLDARLKAFRTLTKEEKWDLFFGVVMETDRLNHFYWGDYSNEGEYYDEFIEVYKKIDAFLGEFRASLPENTELIVMSDHGFTDLRKEFDVNAWLREQGFLQKAEKQDGSLDIQGDAYSLIPGRIYVDLESRRPGGSVPDDAYDEKVAELTEALQGAEDPETGERVVEQVYTRDDLYSGPFADMGPDLVAHPVDGYDLKGAFEEKPVVSDGPRSGMHTLPDASLLSTADLENGGSVWDVAPTILDLLGLEADGMDGRSLVR